MRSRSSPSSTSGSSTTSSSPPCSLSRCSRRSARNASLAARDERPSSGPRPPPPASSWRSISRGDRGWRLSGCLRTSCACASDGSSFRSRRPRPSWPARAAREAPPPPPRASSCSASRDGPRRAPSIRRCRRPRITPGSRCSTPCRAERPAGSSGSGPILLPNAATLYGLEDVRGYESMTFRPLYETYPLWSRPLGAWFNIVEDLDRPFLSFLNVRWALALPGTAPPRGWTVRASGPGGVLLENAGALPRAFVPVAAALGPGPPREADGPRRDRRLLAARSPRRAGRAARLDPQRRGARRDRTLPAAGDDALRRRARAVGRRDVGDGVEGLEGPPRRRPRRDALVQPCLPRVARARGPAPHRPAVSSRQLPRRHDREPVDPGGIGPPAPPASPVGDRSVPRDGLEGAARPRHGRPRVHRIEPRPPARDRRRARDAVRRADRGLRRQSRQRRRDPRRRRDRRLRRPRRRGHGAARRRARRRLPPRRPGVPRHVPVEPVSRHRHQHQGHGGRSSRPAARRTRAPSSSARARGASTGRR